MKIGLCYWTSDKGTHTNLLGEEGLHARIVRNMTCYSTEIRCHVPPVSLWSCYPHKEIHFSLSDANGPLSNASCVVILQP